MKIKKFTVVALISLLCISVVWAVLTPYISNEVEISGSVGSAMTLGVSDTEVGMISDCSGFTQPLNPGPLAFSVVGFETLRYYTQVKVNSENDLGSGLQDVIFNWSMTNSNGNPACADISNIALRVKSGNNCTDWSGALSLPLVDLSGFSNCSCDAGVCTVLVPTSYNPGEAQQYEINITFGNVVPATYTFSEVVVVG